MSSDFLTDLLAAVFQEQGVANARQVAEKAAASLRRAKVVDPKRVQMVERNRRIYELRASGVEVQDLCARFGLKRWQIATIVREELELRRAS